MGGTWNLFQRIGRKKVDEMRDSSRKSWEDRIDKDLPLGLRINGMVDITQVDFILGGADLKIKYPGTGCIVVSYGRVPVGDSEAKRFYLDASEKVYMLQVVINRKHEVGECKLFMPFDEIYPEDWDFWLSARDGYIGLDPFQTQDGTAYFRVWEDPGALTVLEEDDKGNRITRIPPVRLTETIYLDPYGEKTEIVRYESMLYGRKVNDNVDEYLLVSAVEESDGASVQLMVGIPLESVSIKAI